MDVWRVKVEESPLSVLLLYDLHGIVAQHYDAFESIVYVSEAFDCYRRFSLQKKEKLPVSAGYFLGRVKKGYELAGAYGV